LKLPNGLSHAVKALWGRITAFFVPNRGVGHAAGLQALQGDSQQQPTSPTWLETVERIEQARQGPPQPVTGPGVTGTVCRSASTSGGMASATARTIIARCATLASLDPAPLMAVAGEIEALVESGSNKQLDALLRSCCPKDRWMWPQADEVFAMTGARGTRLQQIALLTSMLFRQFMWATRLPQLKQIAPRRPYLQFRVAGDIRTPASCAAEDGRIELHTHAFWTSRAPWTCTRAECRCSVRTFSLQDLIDKGLPVPGQ
jgi:hypothetical protein